LYKNTANQGAFLEHSQRVHASRELLEHVRCVSSHDPSALHHTGGYSPNLPVFEAFLTIDSSTPTFVESADKKTQ
jgi:hypothetical protein